MKNFKGLGMWFVLKVCVCVCSVLAEGCWELLGLGAMYRKEKIAQCSRSPPPPNKSHSPLYTTEPCHSSQGKCSLHNRYRGRKLCLQSALSNHTHPLVHRVFNHMTIMTCKQPNYTVQTHNLQCMRVCGHGQPLLLQVTQV